MPNLPDPFGGNLLGRKLTPAEELNAVQFAIQAEFEAIQTYVQIAVAATNPSLAAVMQSIADEERVHVGELLQVLFTLDPKQRDLYNKGRIEAKSRMTPSPVEPVAQLSESTP